MIKAKISFFIFMTLLQGGVLQNSHEKEANAMVNKLFLKANIQPANLVPMNIFSKKPGTNVLWDYMGGMTNFIMDVVKDIAEGSGLIHEDVLSPVDEIPKKFLWTKDHICDPLYGFNPKHEEKIRQLLISENVPYVFLSREYYDYLVQLQEAEIGAEDIYVGNKVSSAEAVPLPLFINPNNGHSPLQLGIIFPKHHNSHYQPSESQVSDHSVKEAPRQVTLENITFSEFNVHGIPEVDSEDTLWRDDVFLIPSQKPKPLFHLEEDWLNTSNWTVSTFSNGTSTKDSNLLQPEGFRRIVNYLARTHTKRHAIK